MNKKQEIKTLKHKLKTCSCHLNLLKKHEHIASTISKENADLKLKVAELEHKLQFARGIVFNYETQFLAP